MRIALVLAAALLTVVPMANAAPQDPLAISSVALANGTGTIPYSGSATVSVTVTVGCATAAPAFGASPGENPEATVAAASPPAWLNVTSTVITFNPAGCLNATDPDAGSMTGTGTITLTVSPEAPGVAPQVVNLTATMELAQGNPLQSQPYAYNFNVSYFVNRTISTSIPFPHTMTGRTLNFTVTVTQTANAPGMVMIENLQATTGTVSGIASADYPAPTHTRTFNVTYTGPGTVWNETTISLRAFSHNTVETNAPTLLEEDFNWVVRNGNPDGSPDSEEAPLGGLPLIVLLGVMALVASRRRK